MRLTLSSRNRAAVLLLFGQLLAAGVAFFVNIFASQILLPAERGELAFLLQISYMLSVIMLLGAERPFIASEEGSFRKVLTMFVRVIRPGWYVLALPALAMIYFFAQHENSWALSCFLLLAFVVSNTLVRVIRTAYIASNESHYFLLSTIGIQFSLLTLVLIFWAANLSSVNIWFAAYAVTGIVAVAIVVVKYDRATSLSDLNVLNIKDVRRRGLRLLPASFGNTAMLRSDRLLLPLLASSAELGIYVVVATVMEIATWPIQQWVDSSLRKWSKVEARSLKSVLILLARSAGIVGVLSLLFGFLAYVVVRFFLEDAYSASIDLIVPLGLSAVFYGMTRVQQGILVAHGRSSSVSFLEISGLLASVALYVVLIPSMGATGAAMGSLFGYAFCFIIGIATLCMSTRERSS